MALQASYQATQNEQANASGNTQGSNSNNQSGKDVKGLKNNFNQTSERSSSPNSLSTQTLATNSSLIQIYIQQEHLARVQQNIALVDHYI